MTKDADCGLSGREKQMNLIEDKWIPVRRKSGKKEKIAPWQITDGLEQDPIIELAAPRPDFNGALIQFLIGLLQTTCAPAATGEWRRWLNNPPSPEELKDKFNDIAFAFNLDGDGPRFMQDYTLEAELDQKSKPKSVEGLLLDSQVGEKTLNENTDFFVKHGKILKLCNTCATEALLTLQQNSPEGGRGYVTGLRGGGPVTVIVLEEVLWRTLWMNILDKGRFENLANVGLMEDKDRFPWIGETRTSKNKKVTTCKDIHPAQIYWSMPRRVRLVFVQRKVVCDLCGEICNQMTEEFFQLPHGVKYKSVLHPLTPTGVNSENELFSVHQREAVGYKYWLGYVQTFPDKNRKPTEIVMQVLGRRIFKFRLWAFGYDTKKDKVRCWYEGVMPVVTIEDEEKRVRYEAEIAVIIRAADTIAYMLGSAVKTALAVDGKLQSVVQRFWQVTEADFYELISKIRGGVINDRETLPIRQEWHRVIVQKAEQIFDQVSQTEMIDDVNVKRVADAWNRTWNRKRGSMYGRKLRQEILGLPEQTHEAKSS